MNCPTPLYRLKASPASLCALGYMKPGSQEFLGKRPHRGAYFFSSKQLDLIPTELRSNLQPIGCGSCIACRLTYAQEWSLRLRLEASLYPCNLFLTLTYDDDHLPDSVFIDESSGVVHVSELRKRDLSAFMKRLRSSLQERFNFTGVRFFAPGEYGDKTDRPHYHAILLNCPPEIMSELVFLSKTKRGDILYSSPYFDSIWKNGFVTVGSCSAESIGYVARYALKKVGALDRSTMREAPFALMSRRPGIGAPFFYKFRDSIESTGKVVVKDSEGSFVCNAPSYFYYLMYNLPIRAHRLLQTFHYDSSVLEAERKAIEHKCLLKDPRLSALDHLNDSFSEDLVGLPRPGSATSQSRLSSLKSKSEILTKKHKK